MDKEKICGIYCIESKDNKKYIGQSRNIIARFRQHRSSLNRNIHKNSHLQSAWNKYGQDYFDFYIVEQCSNDIIDEREIYYINIYQTLNNNFGYNLDSGGCFQKYRSDETKHKISQSHKGRPSARKGKHLTEEHKQNISKANKGRILSDEIKRKISQSLSGENNPNFGIKRSQEVREALRIANLGKKMSIETREKLSKMRKGTMPPASAFENSKKATSKRVAQYSMDGQKINEYYSCREAGRQLGISSSHISAVCRGELKHFHKFIFQYV